MSGPKDEKVVRVRVQARRPNPGAGTYADLPFSNDTIIDNPVSYSYRPYGDAEEEMGVQGRCIIGLLWDECTNEVSNAILRDVLTLHESLKAPMTLVLMAKDDATVARLKALTLSSGRAPIALTVDADVAKRTDVNAWFRYWTTKRPPLNKPPEQVVDRDFQKGREVREENEGALSDRKVIPTGPYVPRGRGVGQTSNPLAAPLPNPLANPTFMYSRKTKALRR